MKRKLLVLSGFVFISFLGTAQNQSTTVEKTETTVMVFKTQKEKQEQVTQTEKAIQVRLDKGRTKAELRPLYARLERINNAKIVSNEK